MWIIAVWLIFQFFSAHAQSPKLNYYNPKLCGRHSRYSSFVLTDETGKTGHPTHLAPWAVQIRVKSMGGDVMVICGGTLITSKHVLTAAHCFQRHFGSAKPANGKSRYCEPNQRFSDADIVARTSVIVGAMCTKISEKYGCVNEKQNGQSFNIKRFAMGDFFTTNCEKGNDIMVLELEDTVDDVEGANYACLPFLPVTDLPAGSNVTSFGWGSDPGKGFDHSAFPMIQILTLVPESIETCGENWGIEAPFDAFCTAEEEDKNVCSGDSGGGVTFRKAHSSREYLIAVISYGSDCVQLIGGTQPRSQINTDVRKHKNFIVDFINGR